MTRWVWRLCGRNDDAAAQWQHERPHDRAMTLERVGRGGGECTVVVARDRLRVGLCDDGRVLGWCKRELSKRGLADIDELAVLGAACVVHVRVMRDRSPVGNRVDRDDQARDCALDPHRSIMHLARA
jgi:hypothetical protein